MLRGLGILVIMALLGAATVGLSGGGPEWLRYVGSGTLFVFLLLILGQLSQLPDKAEYREMIDQLLATDEDIPGAPQIGSMPPGGGEMPPGMPGGMN